MNQAYIWSVASMATKFFTPKKTRGTTLSEVNVIPLVDIVFTLLIIFMILAPMIHKGIEVQVPESAVGEVTPERNQHIISITQQGAIWFDNQEIGLENLPGYLQDLPPQETVYVQADQTIPYGTVIDVISAIKAEGIQQVGLITQPRPQAQPLE
jgi:biopolymer transport protein TolR